MKRCGAKNRQGNPCQRFALKQVDNGRCRLHGGLSTGARTEAGKQRQLTAKLKHGRYSQQWMAQKRLIRQQLMLTKKMMHSANEI